MSGGHVHPLNGKGRRACRPPAKTEHGAACRYVFLWKRACEFSVLKRSAEYMHEILIDVKEVSGKAVPAVTSLQVAELPFASSGGLPRSRQLLRNS